MRVRKTFAHGGVTLAHGAFHVRETVHVCAAGCTQPDLGSAHGRALVKRQAAVAELLPPRSTVGYDVMTFVGLERFLHYRQRDEILAALEQKYHIVLSSGEVSELGRRFLVYLEALHHARAPDLRAALAKDGGWPLHIDATGEDGQGTLLVPYAGWRGWAMGAWKIPTERADAVLPKLRAVEALFGAPCAVMRDLGKAMIEAARDFVAGREELIPVLGCHMHFLKDIGKDLLRTAHDDLCDLFRRFEVLPRLRALARDLGRTLGTEIQRARRELTDWLAGTDPQFRLPEGNAGLAAVRALGQWVLDYPDDGTDAVFPFDRPWLDLYLRCLRSCRAAESWLRKPCADRRVLVGLERLHRIVEPVRSELPFQIPVRTIQQRARLFDELRDVILNHLDHHGPSLWGHVIALPPTVGGGIRLVARTNVLLESFFHEIKHGERRRSGRKVLTQDLEQLPASAVLACNLTKSDYVSILCGSLDDLPHAFAQLDAVDRSRSLPARILTVASTTISGQDSDIVSSSLPRTDRDLVRTAAMQERVLAEARSRAPRRPATLRAALATVV
jgi:hypothetical protein